jgi:hypothetical protein
VRHVVSLPLADLVVAQAHLGRGSPNGSLRPAPRE